MASFQGVVILLASVLVAAEASCWFSPIKNETTFFGSKRYYCEYTSHAEITDHHPSMNNETRVRMNVTVGSTFDTLDCEHCQCRQDGLHCCGTGFYAGTFQVPKKCDVVPDGCEPIIVLAADHKLNCFTKKPIRPNQYGMVHVSNIGPQGMDQVVRRVFHSSSDSEKPKIRTQPMMVANRLNSHWPENIIENMVTRLPTIWPAQNPMRSSSSRTVRISTESDNVPLEQSSRSVHVSSGSPMAWPISQDPQKTFARSVTMRRTNEPFPNPKEEVVSKQKQQSEQPSTDMELNRLLALKLLGLA